jgi:hypothetical protein
MPFSMRLASQPWFCAGRSSFDARTGEKVRARKAEKATAAAMATASSTNRRPM